MVEDALVLPSTSARKGYSLRDLRAFQIAAPLYRDTVQAPEAPSSVIASAGRG
ncbi:hypothetical protein [Haliangium ochraceum]|uniref:hypothetical protein n=1 Tax=Haliangium ochraceum TaxID=80816 RepID=UPI00019BA8CC|nr:hypothetical protein [Haliangium ochraceum]